MMNSIKREKLVAFNKEVYIYDLFQSTGNFGLQVTGNLFADNVCSFPKEKNVSSLAINVIYLIFNYLS